MNVMTRRAVLGAIPALGVAGSMRSAGAQSADSVNIGRVVGVTEAPFYIGEHKGFFRDVGININWTTFNQSQAMLAPLAAGQLDGLGSSVGAGIYNAIGNGVPIKIVGDRGIDYAPYGAAPIIVRTELIKSGRFKSFKDLKGLKVVEPSRGGANTPVIYRALQKGGLTYGDIDHAFLGFSDQVAAMHNGIIDVTCMIEPFASVVLRDGSGTKFAADTDVYPNHQISTLMYSSQFMQRRPDVARRFFVGYLRAIRYYHDALKDGKLAGPTAEDVIAILQAEIKLPDPTIWRSIVPNAVQTDGRVNEASLQFDYHVFNELGLILKPVSVHDSIDYQFADYANHVLGPYHASH